MNRMASRTLVGFFFFCLILLFQNCKNKTFSQGERLYLAHCANCHMEDGKGLAKLIPPLANSDYLRENQALIPCILRHGQEGKILVNGVWYDQKMAGEKYSEVQINNIINYINSAWGNNLEPVTIVETKKRLSECAN